MVGGIGSLSGPVAGTFIVYGLSQVLAVLQQYQMVIFGLALAGFALAHVRLEQALADKSWTAAPGEQTGAYQDLPPAVILYIEDNASNLRLVERMLANGETEMLGIEGYPPERSMYESVLRERHNGPTL